MDENFIGSVRYVGPATREGYLDARTAAQALVGIDEAVRYFASAQASSLSGVEYELPVLVRKGSWEALIPTDVASWVRTVLAAGATAYVVTAAQKVASNDFEEASLQVIFTKALEAIQWAIRLGKHVGSLSRRVFERVEWRNGNREIGIPNGAGDVLYVPYEYFQLYEKMPVALLSKITQVVEEERSLEVVVRKDGAEVTERVTTTHKTIFCPSADEVLFPELVHGMIFDEEGFVTRGNENANSVGFQYQGHILTCYPSDGSIVRFKSALFLRSRMRGVITREDKFGQPTEKRPKIVFDSLIPLEGVDDEAPVAFTLFDDDESGPPPDLH